MRKPIVSKSEQHMLITHITEVPGGSVVKNLPANARVAGDVYLVPGLERFPGEGNGNPLQYSCLENPMDRRAWWATVHGVAVSDKTEPLHFFTLLTLLLNNNNISNSF